MTSLNKSDFLFLISCSLAEFVGFKEGKSLISTIELVINVQSVPAVQMHRQ